MKDGNNIKEVTDTLPFREQSAFHMHEMTLALCIKESGETNRILKHIRDHYQVSENKTRVINGEQVDAYVMDIDCFEDNKKHLLELREMYGPDLHPVLVIIHDESDLNDHPDAWDIADDIIKVGSSVEYLDSRINLMLRYRSIYQTFRENQKKLENQQQKLRKEKDFLYYVAENIAGFIFVIDEDNRFQFWNRNFKKELDYSEEMLRKSDFLDLFDEDERDAVILKLNEVRCNLQANFEATVITGTGESRVIHFAASLIEQGGEEVIIGSGWNITERVNAEYRIHQHEQLIEAIINQSKSIIYVKDSSGKLKLVNQAFLDLFGASRNEILHSYDRKILDPELSAQIRKNDQEVLQKDAALEFEEYIEVDGEGRYFQTLKYPLKGVPGFEGHICGISSEITDKKKLILDLEYTNRRKNGLLFITNQIEQFSETGKILRSAVKSIPQAFRNTDKTFARIIFGDDTYSSTGFKEGNDPLCSNVFSVNGISLRIIIEKDSINKENQYSEEDQKLLNSICQAISSRLNRLENLQRLHESEERWENLVQNDPDLVMILQDNEIKFLNKAGACMYGTSPDTLIGVNLFDAVQLDDLSASLMRMDAVKRGNKVEPKTYRIRHPQSGKVRHLRVQSLPIQHNGRPAIQVVGTDVTELVHSEKELMNSLQEKEVLLQEVHHRVKNNLAVISSFLQLKLMTSNNEELMEVLRQSVTRVKSIALVHEKLYQQHSLSNIDFKDYLKDLTKHISETWETGPDIRIREQIDPVMLNVNQAVPCALMVNEILTNSMKYAFEGSDDGRVEISVSRKNTHVFIEIRDNGPGYPADILKKDSMGLSIIKTLSEQLEADLIMENDKGAVTRFNFRCREIKGSVSHHDLKNNGQ